MTEDEKYMKAALGQARKALALDEAPIGCVIVRDGKISEGKTVNYSGNEVSVKL